jgi:tetratricopeptide (TPR) repeat protein
MHQRHADSASSRDQFAQLLRHTLQHGDLSQATLARRLRQHGISQVTEPRVSDWVHGRCLPRDEGVVFAIEKILADMGAAVSEGDLVTHYWAARREPKQPSPSKLPGDRGLTTDDERTPVSGELPTVWNLPYHANPFFTGRDPLLAEVQVRLAAMTASGRVALTGLGGVGKTQLAVEYAYRRRADYDLVWWIRGEQPTSLLGDYAALADQPPLEEDLRLGEDVRQDAAVAAVRTWLERHRRWLLVLDNLETPPAVADLLPRSATGHVLLTSQAETGWEQLADPLLVEVLPPTDAAAFLLARTGQQGSEAQAAAGALAATLGGLPLALEQAAAYVAAAGTVSLADYAELFSTRALELLKRGQPLGYEETVATTWSLVLQRLKRADPAAVDLLTLVAFLAPDDIPRSLIATHGDQLPGTLADAASDPVALGDAVAALRRYSLVRVVGDDLFVHRLLQTVVRAGLISDRNAERTWSGAAIRLLRAGYPSSSAEVANWAICQRLLPHVLIAGEHSERLGVESRQSRWLLKQAAAYLRSRGQLSQCKLLAERIVASAEQDLGGGHPETLAWNDILGQIRQALGELRGRAARELHEYTLAGLRQALGDDHPATLTAMNSLALARRALGDLHGARELHEQAADGFRRRFGEDHSDSLLSMNNLAEVRRHLGDVHGALDLHRRVFAARLRTGGPDHPETLTSMNCLAVTLRTLGDFKGARDMHQQALAGARRVLGDDHPTTLILINNLAETHRALGDLQAAHDLHQEALAGFQRRRGDDHPETLASMDNLALARRGLGDLQGARALHEQALNGRRRIFGDDYQYRHTLASMNNLAELRRALADLEGADELHEYTLATYRRVLGDDHPETLTSMHNLALTRRDRGDPQGAHRLLAQAVSGLQRVLGDDHPSTRSATIHLADNRKRLDGQVATRPTDRRRG